jgi:serine/threonine-protein kinase
MDVYRSKATTQTGAILGDRWILHGFMGKGATSRVYLAEDAKTKAAVAVKLYAATTSEARERFLREARATMTIDHPNVIKVLGFGERGDGTPYFVTEVLQGEPLGDYLRRQGAMPVELALPLFRQAAAGLAAAHAAGLVHRDVKPDNLFLIGDVGEPYGLKVIDFGLAKEKKKRASSAARIVLGTIEYMAPEQVLTDPIDARSDVYTLGMVMFRTLTGQLPFSQKNDIELLAHQVLAAIPPPSWLVPTIDPRIDTVVVSATRKHPDNRYASMEAMREDLDRLLGVTSGDPIGAKVTRDEDRYAPRGDFSTQAIRALYGKLKQPCPY